MICLSVMFVKQHSAVDVLAALPVGVIAEYFVYRERYYPPFPKAAKKP